MMIRYSLSLLLGLLLLSPAAFAYDFDIVVVGGGEAGVAAAVQAAWLGMSVAITEESDYIGGMMTASGVTSMDGNYQGFHRTGIYRNFTDKVISHYAAIGRKVGVCYWNESVICFEPKVGETILRRMLTEANVTLYERSRPVAAFNHPGSRSLEKVLFSDGRVLSARRFVEATEYGDLMAVANVKHRAGNRTSPNLNAHGCVQPFTYTAVVKQYDVLPSRLKFKTAPPGYNSKDWTSTVTRNGSNKIGVMPWSWDFFKIYRAMPDSTRPNRNDLTKTGLNVDTNDYWMNVSQLEFGADRFALLCAAKLKTLQFMYYIQKELDDRWSISLDEKYDTAFNKENSCPNIPEELKVFEQQMPVIPYIREARRVFGLYALTLNDTFRTPTRDAREFEDSVAIGDYEEDLHGCLDYESEFNECDPWPSKLRKAFEIPMRSLIPESADGLVVAGKLISVSRLANGASRNQPVSMLTGQAAGVIAAISIREGVQPRDLNVKLVQKVLDEFKVTYKARPPTTAATMRAEDK